MKIVSQDEWATHLHDKMCYASERGPNILIHKRISSDDILGLVIYNVGRDGERVYVIDGGADV